MNPKINLFFRICLFIVTYLCLEQGQAQGCRQASDCPYYNNPTNVSGSWNETCENASISCERYNDIGKHLCTLTATCQAWNKSWKSASFANYQKCKKGIINYNGYLDCPQEP